MTYALDVAQQELAQVVQLIGNVSIQCPGMPQAYGAQGCITFIEDKLQQVEQAVQDKVGCSFSDCATQAEQDGLAAVSAALDLADQCLAGETAVCANAFSEAAAAEQAVVGAIGTLLPTVVGLGGAVVDVVTGCVAGANQTCSDAIGTASTIAAAAGNAVTDCVSGATGTCAPVQYIIATAGMEADPGDDQAVAYYVDDDGTRGFDRPITDPSGGCYVSWTRIRATTNDDTGTYSFSTTLSLDCPTARSINVQAHMRGSVGPRTVNKYSPTTLGTTEGSATVTFTDTEPCNEAWKINLHTDSNTSYFVTKRGQQVSLQYDGPSLTNEDIDRWCF